jgi:sensor histidine kinase YesM
MGNFGATFNCLMTWSMFWMVNDLSQRLTEISAKVEREELTQTLGCVPNQEEIQYYRELKQEKETQQQKIQREANRKKIRRLVFGDEE